MGVEFWLGVAASLVSAAFTAGVTWASLNSRVKAAVSQAAVAKAEVDTLCDTVTRLESQIKLAAELAARTERSSRALHTRVDDHDRSIAILRERSEHHLKLIEGGFAEIKGAISSLHSRLDEILRERRS